MSDAVIWVYGKGQAIMVLRHLWGRMQYAPTATEFAE